MPVATFPLGPLETNSYLLHNADQAVAVDVGGDPAPMLDYLRKHKLALAAICITHRHFDHLYGVATLEQATDAPVYVPGRNRARADCGASRRCRLSAVGPCPREKSASAVWTVGF